MLFAGLQRHAQRHASVHILRNSDQPAGQLPHVLGSGRQIGGVRPAVTERHAEPLRAADGHVGAQLPGGNQHRQGEQIGRHHHQRAVGMGALDEGPVVVQLTVGRRVLQQGAEDLAIEPLALDGGMITHDQIDPEGLGARLEDRDGLRMTGGRDPESAPGLLGAGRHGVQHVHGLGGGRALVEQRRVGDGQPGQITNHRLEVQQRLEAPLGDLRLIRGVLGVPAGILEDVALNDGRGDAIRIAEPDE